MEEVFANIKEFSPEVVYLTVNKKINSRFYLHRVREENEMKKVLEKNTEKKDEKTENNLEKKEKLDPNVVKNPPAGSVIYCQMSGNDMIDFLLAPQNVEQGCTNPCQYRLVFYHQEKTKFGTPLS